jgi:pimeloyl-ACP methyl ester carboxylesterase
MANPLVILIPGFMGSGIVARLPLVNLDEVLWLNYSRIGLQALGPLQLDDQGLEPVISYYRGRERPFGLLLEYYGRLYSHLKQTWDVATLAYDWRLGLQGLGIKALAEINTRFPNRDYYVVGHSMGGLVARMVWRLAGQAGTQARIKRIVTLGTPHWGTYAAVQALAHQGDLYSRISQIWFVENAIVGAMAPYIPLNSPTDTLDKIIASWPGLYDLFPSLQQPASSIRDPQRSSLYQAATWAGINRYIDPDWLAEALGTWSLTGTIPPADRLVCVAGIGQRTADRLVPLAVKLGEPAGYLTADGDGVVTLASAQIAFEGPTIASDHATLPTHPGVLERINGWLLDGPPQEPAAIVGGFGIEPGFGPLVEPRYTSEFLEPEQPPTPVPIGAGHVVGDC